METPLWICEFCGGPANWTFIQGEVFFHCQRQCDAFRQKDMFEVEGLTHVSEYVILDESISVSASERERETMDFTREERKVSTPEGDPPAPQGGSSG